MIGIGLLRRAWELRNRDYIPKLPRGAYATDYKVLDEDSRRAMARLGIRSPSGLDRALRLAGVESVDELVAQLDHYSPQRMFLIRLGRMFDRVRGASITPPCRDEVMKLKRVVPADVEIGRRLAYVSKVMRED